MKDKFNLLKNAKYIVLIIFACLSILSLILMGKVGTNYNISDYLDESTDTKISLGIMEEEFGLISNIQVMVDDVTVKEAEEIKAKLKAVENVVFVNFNSQNADYYKDGTALFVILVNGNEYSDTALTALTDIMELMDDSYAERVNYGGMVMEKKLLREVMQQEIFLILVISICLVAVLMLITASSWIEPLVLLAAAGIAVLLNMGSNIIFGEISYITKAVAAILQLALSMDYSIVLLHSYRTMKEKVEDKDKAMLCAIKEVIAPVSASALTTIAGLLALLFMSFRIGFDIGIVLMKSIVISAITAITLLPAMLLILDKLMQKTAKKPLVIKGQFFCDLSLKAGKVLVPVAVVIIAICCILSSYNTYNFVDSCNKNENITDKFGDSGTLIVLYEKAEDSDEKEKLLSSLLASYKTKNGTPVLKSSVAYSSTVGQIFDVKKASLDLGIPEKDAELLFTVYYFSQDESRIKMNTRDFVDFAIKLIETDEDAQGFVSEETAKTLKLLLNLDVMLGENYTAAQLGDAIGKLEMLEGMTLEQSSIDQMYGLFFYDQIQNKSVNFSSMLSFLTTLDKMLGEELAGQLDQLLDGIGKLEDPSKPMNFKAFQALAKEFGIQMDDNIFGIDPLQYYWTSKISPSTSDSTTVPYLTLLQRLKKDGYVSSPELSRIIDNYNTVYTKANSSYEYQGFFPALIDITRILTGTAPDVNVSNELTQQLYIMYFVENNRIPNGEISCVEFLDFVLETAKTNATVAERLPEGAVERLEKLIKDADSIGEFLDDDERYDYKGITEAISRFAENIQSIDVNVSLSEGAMMGVFVKYAIANNSYELGELSATTLLDFVTDAVENNHPLLSGRINEDMKNTIEESRDNINSAEGLLKAENYSRMLLTVNLPPESEESSRFVEYLTAKVREIFGNGAYVAGEIATTYDLINAFDSDNAFISVFTVISIFLIILVIFKSLSLPVILVAVIQGAIWIAMSMSLIGSGSMFFMSYIMSSCILMGATIDYGILLSTNYVRARKDMDKREALNFALDAAMPTIFTSGLILMICGFVVGFVASQTSISSVGFLLFRGTMVSVIMITLVLPALLYLLDKIVLKLTIAKSLSEMIGLKKK